MKPINVIVVDDSAFMRKSLATMIESHPDLKVVATGRDGKEGVELVKKFRPDVVTMDIEMPVMDGLSALSTIMKECPTPVMMVSSLTTEGATATLDALERGAVDFIPKQLSYVSLDILKIKNLLHEKIIGIASSRRPRRAADVELRRNTTLTSPAPGTASGAAQPLSAVPTRPVAGGFAAAVIGVSTGGPQALMRIAPKFPSSSAIPIIIVQHMPPKFTTSLAERLNAVCPLPVREVEDGETMENGTVYLAPGGRQLILQRVGMKTIFRVNDESNGSIYKPSVDVLMNSASEQLRKPLLGVIMTGMGRDGLEGLKTIKSKGGYVVAQSEDSCVVYGMPRAAIESKVSDVVLNVEDIPMALAKLIS